MAHMSRWMMTLLSISACNQQGGETDFSELETNGAIEQTLGASTQAAASCSLTAPATVVAGVKSGSESDPFNFQVDEQSFYFIQASTGVQLFAASKNQGAKAGVGGFVPAALRYDYAVTEAQRFTMTWGSNISFGVAPGSIHVTSKIDGGAYTIRTVSSSCRVPVLNDVVADVDGSIYFSQNNLGEVPNCDLAARESALEWALPGSKNGSPIAIPPNGDGPLTLALNSTFIFWSTTEGI
jgi:hypothetical protein